MHLPDEHLEYDFSRAITPATDGWSPLLELQSRHLIAPDSLDRLRRLAESARSQIASTRELAPNNGKDGPVYSGFIDHPQRLLDQFRRKGEESQLGKVLQRAARLRESCGRVIFLAAGGEYLAAKGFFEALRNSRHNELPANLRLGVPRIYFEGHTLENDPTYELLELLENTCVDPDLPEERWGLVVIDPVGNRLSTAAAYRAFREEAAKLYGPKAPELRECVVPVTGKNSQFRHLLTAEGFTDKEILTTPEDVAPGYTPFTCAGLIAAAVFDLDVRALLLGAAALTRRFLEEPFERNPVLQLAAVNHLAQTELNCTVRANMVWSRKLQLLSHWYDQLVAESLGKAGKGPTPMTLLGSQDVHRHAQQQLEGARDKWITNIQVRSGAHPPIILGMAENNQDGLNDMNRKGYPDFLTAASRGSTLAQSAFARPTTDLTIPTLSEFTIGQMLQMFMLATVVEARLANVNPYTRPSAEKYEAFFYQQLEAIPNLPLGERSNLAHQVASPKR